jgi:hypothetical protein
MSPWLTGECRGWDPVSDTHTVLYRSATVGQPDLVGWWLDRVEWGYMGLKH